MAKSRSMVVRLEHELSGILDVLSELLRDAPIRRLERQGGGVVIVAPEFYWGSLTSAQKAAHMDIKRRFDKTIEVVHAVFSGATRGVEEELSGAEASVRQWLELESNWSLKPQREHNERAFREATKKLLGVIEILGAGSDSGIVLVPDTNSLLGSFRPLDYKAIADQDAFEFVLLPTVLAELDTLKVNHRNQDVREKAKKVISVIKGWRTQGSLLSGVTVNKHVTVRSVAVEPNMAESLSWLDPDNNDDRMIASILPLQSKRPSSAVILVTGDINLQNKAEYALIEFAENPVP